MGWAMFNFVLLVMLLCFALFYKQCRRQALAEECGELEESVILLDLAAVKAALDKNADLAARWRSSRGCTLLHVCIRYNYEPFKSSRVLAMCRLLIEEGGVDPSLHNWQSGWTPLHTACFFDLPHVAAFLLTDTDSLACPFAKDFTTPAHLAAANGHVCLLKEILKKGGPNALCSLNNRNLNPLCLAAEFGHLDAVDFMLRLGSNIPLRALDSPAWQDKVLLERVFRSVDHSERQVRSELVSSFLSQIPSFPLAVELIVHSYMQINTMGELRSLRGCQQTFHGF